MSQPQADPLLWLGQTRSAALRDVLRECAAVWRQRWSLAQDFIEVAIAQEGGESAVCKVAGGAATVAGSPLHGVLLYLWASAEALSGVLGVPANRLDAAGAEGSRGLARQLQLEALRSLCTELLQAGGVDEGILDDRAGVELTEGFEKYRWVVATISFGSRAKFTLALSAQCIELLLPRKEAARLPDALARRRHVITDEPVCLQAVLGDVEISLSDLARLAEGDIIVLDQPLVSAARLALPDGKSVANIILGRCGRQRAISVVKQGAENPV